MLVRDVGKLSLRSDPRTDPGSDPRDEEPWRFAYKRLEFEQEIMELTFVSPIYDGDKFFHLHICITSDSSNTGIGDDG